MSNPPELRVSGKYGAPMGRAPSSSYTDRNGEEVEVTVNENAGPFSLRAVRLDSGGYDAGGAYWGQRRPGERLYYYEGPLTDIHGYVDGTSREAAKAAVREAHPLARFYR